MLGILGIQIGSCCLFWFRLFFAIDLDHEWSIHGTFGNKGAVFDDAGILNVDGVSKSPFVLIDINRD